jgi:hypothetical protein
MSEHVSDPLDIPGLKSPLDVTAKDIIVLQNAVIVPPHHRAPNSAGQQSGVFDSDGNFVMESVTWRPNGGAFNTAPEHPAEGDIHDMGGTYMFGGPFYGHFGHFLMDSLARIWALDHIKPALTGVVFTPKHNGKNVEHVVRTYGPMARALGMTQNIMSLRVPTRVDRLFVPRQGIGLDNWSIGSHVFRDYMAKNGGTSIAPRGGSKLYVSRSELPLKRSSILAEKVIEEYLIEEGYEIFHPQRASQEEQIARYRGAEYIISPDGSPLHTLAYVGHENQKVAVLARRSNDTSTIFEQQLRAFNNCFAMTINALRYDWLPEKHRVPNRLSWGEVDVDKLFAPLKENGFINGSTPWPAVDSSVREAQLAQIEEIEGMPFHRYDPHAQ